MSVCILEVANEFRHQQLIFGVLYHNMCVTLNEHGSVQTVFAIGFPFGDVIGHGRKIVLIFVQIEPRVCYLIYF